MFFQHTADFSDVALCTRTISQIQPLKDNTRTQSLCSLCIHRHTIHVAW